MAEAARSRRATFTLASQGISSVTNFAIAALALDSGTLAEFGRFAMAFQVCQMMIVIGQDSLGDAVLIHASADPHSLRAVRLRRGAAGAAAAVGLAATAVLVTVGLLLGGAMRTPLVLAGLGAPALIAQYLLRARRFSAGQPGIAMTADAVWLSIVLAAGGAAALGWWESSPNGYLAVWLLGAAISAAPTLYDGFVRGWREIVTFWNEAGRPALRLGVEAGLARSIFVTSLVCADLIIGTSASGALAASVVVLSPMSVLHAAMSSYYVPRHVSRSGIHLPGRHAVVRISAALVVATLVWVGAVVVANVGGLARGPFDLDRIGVSWALFAATAARFLGLAAWRGPLVALRVANATETSLRVRAWSTLAQWVLPVVGFAAAGLVAGAWGIAVGAWVGVAAAFAACEALQLTDRPEAVTADR